MLRDLESRPEDLPLLLKLQLSLLQSLKQTERTLRSNQQKQRALKQILCNKRLDKREALITKATIKRIQDRIELQKRVLSIWRFFGDGIAFLYLDKWAVKPLLYNVRDANVKQEPGSITGKSGLAAELRALRFVLNSGVPALLNDLTNCIRHGDICLLGGSDPVLIEVKSSENTNSRTARQSEAIRSIHDYHATDLAKDLRGFPSIRRVALAATEIHHRQVFDRAIESARTNGHFVEDPEPGLRVVAITRQSKSTYNEAFAGLSNSPLVFFLNDFKNRNEWGVYFPFTLSFRSVDNLYAFLNGDVFIVVILDFDALAKIAKQRKSVLTFTNEKLWPLQLEWSDTGNREPASIRISMHFLGRMACELLSWRWVLRENRKRVERLGREQISANALTDFDPNGSLPSA